MGAVIARVGIRSFDLPLALPLRSGSVTLARRAGLLVSVEDEQGHAGIGEAAPLPGLHRETLAEASAQLVALAASLEGAVVPGGCPACHRGHGQPRSPMLPAPQREGGLVADVGIRP